MRYNKCQPFLGQVCSIKFIWSKNWYELYFRDIKFENELSIVIFNDGHPMAFLSEIEAILPMDKEKQILFLIENGISTEGTLWQNQDSR